ncbi:DUF3830 family protein [Jatrophihabitans sp. DSM 45814]
MDLQLTIGQASGPVRLWTEFSPNAIAVLTRGLPVAGDLTHCKWSGSACFITLPTDPFAEVAEHEYPAITLYPGTLALRLTDPFAPNPELLISYGQSEHRWPEGPKAVTPIGEIVGNVDELFAALSSCATTGQTPFQLSPKG